MRFNGVLLSWMGKSIRVSCRRCSTKSLAHMISLKRELLSIEGLIWLLGCHTWAGGISAGWHTYYVVIITLCLDSFVFCMWACTYSMGQFDKLDVFFFDNVIYANFWSWLEIFQWYCCGVALLLRTMFVCLSDETFVLFIKLSRSIQLNSP